MVYRSRLWRRLSGNTPSGLVVLFSLPSPLSKTCGAPSKNTTSLVLELFIAVRNTFSVSAQTLTFHFYHFSQNASKRRANETKKMK
jgi:hypothetical protein